MIVYQDNDYKYSINWRYTNSIKEKMVTICIITNIDTLTIAATGIARCSWEDNFCKEIGRKLSLARAIKLFPKVARKDFWKVYFNRNKKDL